MVACPTAVALVGRPNCGKTTLFNALTGDNQWVGNWPGVTVEGVHGGFDHRGRRLAVVDLPGAYTLTGTRSLDEEVTAEYLAGHSCGVVVNVVDAWALERSLYLTLQVLESQGRAIFDAAAVAGTPVIVALNRIDKARQEGIAVDIEALAAQLGCPVVAISAATGEGLEAFQDLLLDALDGKVPPPPFPPYAADVMALLRQRAGDDAPAARWSAIRALENTSEDDADSLALGAARHAVAAGAARRSVTRTRGQRRTYTDLIDRVVLHPVLGVVCFLAVMYLMFLWTIHLGGGFIDAFDGVSGALLELAPAEFLQAHGWPEWAVLPIQGAGRGARTVASFIPLVMFLYGFLAFLEESGYMARAAVVMDRFMRRIGLPGKAFVPLVVGLGCNVPAVMAARTLEDANDRKATIAMTPFMSCGARLPVYALFAATFFPGNGQNVVFALYLLGIGVAVLTGYVLKRTLFAGATQPLLIELPHYHRPQAGAVLRRAWDRVVSFVKDAGMIVVPVVMVLTILNGVTIDGRVVKSGAEPDTLLASVSRLATPLLSPIGIAPDNWPATVGLFTGIFAKEALVGTLQALYSSDGAAKSETTATDTAGRVREALATIPANLAGIADALLDPLGLGKKGVGGPVADEGTALALTGRFDGAAGAFAYLVFVLLYAPCVATIGAIRRESGGAWTAFVLAWTSVMGFSIATLVYQGATFARHPLSSLAWGGGVVVAALVVVSGLRWQGRRQRFNLDAAGGACGGCTKCGTGAKVH